VILVQAAVFTLSYPADARVEVTAEAGPELDTNAHRVQPIVLPCPAGYTCENGKCVDSTGAGNDSCVTTPEDPLLAGLFRITANFRYGHRWGEHGFSIGYGGGGKVFLADDAREADELVHRGRLGWASRLPRGGVLSFEGSFYDAYQRESIRDFRTGAGLARLALGRRESGLIVTTSVGYRGLQYKPIDDYNFHGPQAGVDLSSLLQSGGEDDQVDWALNLSYWLGLRQFSGVAEGVPLPCPGADATTLCNQPTTSSREDLNHLLRAEVNYLGNADASLWYTLEVNQSNSHGETFSRHIIGLKFTAPLYWGIFFTTKGVLQFSRFRDPYLISRIPNETFVTIEDENRSRLILQLARDLNQYLSLNLRYSLYVNESVTQADTETAVRIPDFRRQTVFLGLRVEYSS
jgi:hypothetical protein